MTVKVVRTCFLVPLLVLSLVLVSQVASAQFNSTIQGTVTDAQKGVLPGATVRSPTSRPGQARETVTSTDGVFTVVSLAVGTYRIEVELDGFRKSTREASVGISETARVDFTLEVSGIAENVTVSATVGHDRNDPGPRLRPRGPRRSCRKCRSTAGTSTI